MPWKELSVMDDRMRFIVLLQENEYSMAELCRVFSISRKTGYKWLARYRAEGPSGLEDRSHAHKGHPAAIRDEIAQLVLDARREHPRWGARKLKAFLERIHPEGRWPATSTIGRLLKREGLTVPTRRRRRTPPYSEPFISSTHPNATWCADYKGWFKTGDGVRCEPLTLSDAYSRYGLGCQVATSTTYEIARPFFECAFNEYGLPEAIRTDNGPPFASRGLGGLSRLSVWWLKLGIIPERIEPGHPEQNGRHERFHLTLKQETAQPPQETLELQQRAFDEFRREYNYERPHEALGLQPPAEFYIPSPRLYPSRIPEMEYERDWEIRRVKKNGEMKWHGTTLYVSSALAGEPVGLKRYSDRFWKLFFGALPLTWLDSHGKRLVGLQSKRVLKEIADDV